MKKSHLRVAFSINERRNCTSIGAESLSPRLFFQLVTISTQEAPMRVSGFVSGFVSILAGSMLAVTAPAALAQGIVGGMISGGIGTGSGQVAGASKLPYTYTCTNKTVQTLANGTTITRERTTRMARDSSGRTYTEIHNTLPAGEDGQPREMVNYFVNDPVARTTTMWNSQGKDVTVRHMAEPQTIQARPAQERTELPTVQLPDRVDSPKNDVRREELGTKNIAGVNAKGTRVTQVIPAGRDGNDQPITITTETWRSAEYGLVLESVRDDPRFGTMTREVTEFTAGEPDAALFKDPEGYNVRDVPAQMFAPLP
jgi:hypothetical protein